jgi:hypothetical protein
LREAHGCRDGLSIARSWLQQRELHAA